MPQLGRMVRVFLVALLALWSAIAVADPVVSVTRDCLDAPYRTAESHRQEVVRDRVRVLRAVLQDFPSLLQVLDMQEPQICLSDRLLMEKAFLSPEDNRIVVASDLPPDFMLAVLVHEIRHLDHLVRGVCPSDALAMKHYARATGFLEADANAIGLLIAWKQKADGHPGMWQALESWKMTSDIAERFDGTMQETGDI